MSWAKSVILLSGSRLEPVHIYTHVTKGFFFYKEVF